MPKPDHPLGDRKKPSYRSPHRMRSHDDTHRGAHEDKPPSVLDHPHVPAGEPVLVTTQEALNQLIDRIGIAGRFGYDTEFIGEHSYHPHLCLIQVALLPPDGVGLIDPLAGLDLARFWELIADAGVEKIVHAGGQDLEPVVRHLSLPPRRVFDTQIAAAFAGMPYPMSLDKLVQGLVGIDPGRGAKFSQWNHRPLTPVQLRYAANDVRYLPLLRELIGAKLEALGNTQWAAAACADLSSLDLYQFDASSQRLRVRGVESLGPRQTAILRALLLWRENAAKEQDVPPRTLLRDEVLLNMAREPVASVRELTRVRVLPQLIEREYGQTIVTLTHQALTEPLEPEAPKLARNRFNDDSAAARLWLAIQELCRQRSVDPAVIMSKRDVTQLLHSIRQGPAVVEGRLLQGWRREFLTPVLAVWYAESGTGSV